MYAQILSKPRANRVPEPDPVPRLAAARRWAMVEPTVDAPTPIIPEWMWQPPADPRPRVPRQSQDSDQVLDSTEVPAGTK